MGQDLKYLYRLAGQFIGSEKVKENLTQLTRFADRRFGYTQFADRYYSGVNRKVKTWKPETLGKIVSHGMPEEPREVTGLKAGPHTLQLVGEVPRIPFLKMVPDADYFYFSDKSGFGLLAQLATQVILAAMLDLAEREAAVRDAEKGVHVLDLAVLEIETWTQGELSLEDIELILRTMNVRGQSGHACLNACEAVNKVVENYKASGHVPTHRDEWVSLIKTTSCLLWREGY